MVFWCIALLPYCTSAQDLGLTCCYIILGPNYKFTKTSYDFCVDYLKLDNMFIVSSRLTGTIPYDLSYDYRKEITKRDLGTLS